MTAELDTPDLDFLFSSVPTYGLDFEPETVDVSGGDPTELERIYTAWGLEP